WLKSQTDGLEDKIYTQILGRLEEMANYKAKSCLEKFPTDNELNRVRYKTDRENCLINSWEDLEIEAISKTKGNGLIKASGMYLDNINERLSLERRRIQLKMIKRHFL